MAQHADLNEFIGRLRGLPDAPSWMAASLKAVEEGGHEFEALHGQRLSGHAWEEWEAITRDTAKDDVRSGWSLGDTRWVGARAGRPLPEPPQDAVWEALGLTRAPSTQPAAGGGGSGRRAASPRAASSPRGSRRGASRGRSTGGAARSDPSLGGVLSLAHLETLIRSVYESKTARDLRCQQMSVPRQTMRQYLREWLTGSQTAARGADAAMLNTIRAVEHHMAESSDVAVFAAILNNEVDEEVRWVIQYLRQRIEKLVVDGVLSEAGALRQQRGEVIQKKLGGVLRRDEWSEIVYTVYKRHDAGVVGTLCMDKIASYTPPRKRKGRLSIPNPDAHPGCIRYTDFLKICLDHQLKLHKTFLAKYVDLFREHDSDEDGVLTDEEFRLLARDIAPKLTDAVLATYLDLSDPGGTRRITFSDSVNVLSRHIKPWVYATPEAEFLRIAMQPKRPPEQYFDRRRLGLTPPSTPPTTMGAQTASRQRY